MAAHPFTTAEQTTLAASRHADVLEPLAPVIVGRRIVQLAGAAPDTGERDAWGRTRGEVEAVRAPWRPVPK